jgi:hypothetical protein
VDCTIGWSGFDSWRGLGIFLFDTVSRPVLGPTQPPTQWVPRALSLGIKRLGRETDHSRSSGAEVKEYVELYFHSPRYSSWRGAQWNAGRSLPFNFGISLVTSLTRNDFSRRRYPGHSSVCLSHSLGGKETGACSCPLSSVEWWGYECLVFISTGHSSPSWRCAYKKGRHSYAFTTSRLLTKFSTFTLQRQSWF